MTILYLKQNFNMHKNIFLYRHGVDNDIIDSFFKFIRKKLRNREDREKIA